MDDDTSRNDRVGPAKAEGEVVAWTVLSYLITGPLIFGVPGWLLDRWLNTQVFVPIGLVVGMALSLYVIVLRYGVEKPPDPSGEGDRK